MEDCWKRLPLDIIKQILSYDENIVIRRWGEIVYIGRIPTTDVRYKILRMRPPILGNRVYLPIRKRLTCLLIMVYPEILETDDNNPHFTDNYFIDVLKLQKKYENNYYNNILYIITIPIK
jgi:hypothetical protein